MDQTRFKLHNQQYTDYLITAFKHKVKECRMSAADFISRCTMYPKRRKKLLHYNKEFGPVLSRLAQVIRIKMLN